MEQVEVLASPQSTKEKAFAGLVAWHMDSNGVSAGTRLATARKHRRRVDRVEGVGPVGGNEPASCPSRVALVFSVPHAPPPPWGTATINRLVFR